MTQFKSAEECRNEKIALMGKDLGEVFHKLYQEVFLLHEKWTEYLVLFGTKPERIDLMNRAAPLFFCIVQRSLLKDIILHISRLTDPPKTGRKENLTIKMFPDLVDDPELKNEINELIKSVEKSTKKCRELRNKQIAHHDISSAKGWKVILLSPEIIKEVKDALISLAKVLNAVLRQFEDAELIFDTSPSADGSELLLYYIDVGLKAEEERIDRLKSGKINNKDFSPRDV